MSFSESVDHIVEQNRNQLLGRHVSWERVRLCDVAEILNGFPFASGQFSAVGPGTPLIRIRDILRNATETYFRGEFPTEFIVQRGDLLVGMDGDFNSSIWRGEPGLLNQRCCKISVCAGAYDLRLLAYCLPGYLSAINAHTSSITVKHLSSRTVSEIPLPLPPLGEQQRIADALDELLSDLDEGVAALERARAKLKLYRASVLKAAVDGALTTDWRAEHPDAEPASALLERILIERRTRWEAAQLEKFKVVGKPPPKNWKAKYKPPVAPDTTNLPALPEGWCWASIDQLIREPLRNGHSSKKTNSDAGVPAFTLTAVTDGDFSETNIKLTSANVEKVRDLWAKPDDIFVQRSNTPELVGTTRRYSGEPDRAIFPDLLIRARVTSKVLPAFVERSLQSVRCHTYFRKKAQGISGSMPKIDQEVVERCVVALPSNAEQDAIVEAVEEQLSTLDHLEADIVAKLKSAQALRQAILRDAFAGKLVPQDPNDEPASELLQRIAAEREQRTRLAGAAKKDKTTTGKAGGKPKAGVGRRRGGAGNQAGKKV